MATEWYQVGDTVTRLCNDLIHNHHRHLLDAKIGLVFRSEGGTSNGKHVLGKAQKANQMFNALAGEEYDFIIWLSRIDWEALSPQARRALLDHELCHCVESDGNWSIVGHDIEEFNCIIERHGFWRDEIVKTEKAMTQARILLGHTPTGGVGTFGAETVTFSVDGYDDVTVTAEQFERVVEMAGDYND